MTIKDMPHVTVEQILALREAAIKLEDQNHKLKTRLRAMQECAIGSQGWNWLDANDGASDSSGLHISFMKDLWDTAHADHSDVLGENK